MFRLQVVERPATDLFATLGDDLRSGRFLTFFISGPARSRKIIRLKHKAYPGTMTIARDGGVLTIKVASRAEDSGWKLLRAWIGRLADRYQAQVQSVQILFPEPPAPPARRKR